MADENIFYVYEHWRPDKDVCFYVGKGQKRRAWNLKTGRNQWHMAVQKKLERMGLAVEVKIIANRLSDKEAYIMEIERISYWRSLGRELSNMTAGGEGTNGNKQSAETVEKRVSKFRGKKKNRDGARRTAESHKVPVICVDDGIPHPSMKDAAVYYGIPCRDISAVITGRRNMARGKVFYRGSSPEEVPGGCGPESPVCLAAKKKALLRPVVCLSDGRWFPSITMAAKYYNINKGALCAHLKGVNRTSGKKVFAYEDAV